MQSSFDVIIIGSGPAGVSAAFPLLQKGLNVLMLDAGLEQSEAYQTKPFLESRMYDTNQSSWMIGSDFHSLKMQNAVSPKLRIPSLSYAFNDFKERNSIEDSNFISVGSLAQGGLSNAWGAGVARFSNSDLKKFPVDIHLWETHYKSISERIGISGAEDDDLRDYFGVDAEASSSLPLDSNNEAILKKYTLKKEKLEAVNFKLGRSRIAVLKHDKDNRKACSSSGNCLWGCSNRSIYSAKEDISLLLKFNNFTLVSGVVVKQINEDSSVAYAFSENIRDKERRQFSGKSIILAAGTIASTRLALEYLNYRKPLNLLSSPTAAFLIWHYRNLGLNRTSNLGLGQLSYSVTSNSSIKGFGSTFGTSGIPISEFAAHVPLNRSSSITVLESLLSSCSIGNLFLPGDLTDASVHLTTDNKLKIEGKYKENVPDIMRDMHNKLGKAFKMLGSLILPGSFKIGLPGSDIHYSGSFPMKANPNIGETFPSGLLFGTKNIYMVDGACLPVLPEKSHTLTIMANSERIATQLAYTFIK